MIIFYGKPNTLALPYIDQKTKLQHFFRFVPGKNHIAEKVWLAVVKAAGKRMSYYDTVLTVFKPKDSINVDIDAEDGKETIPVDIGCPEDDIKYEDLNVKEMNALIENTMEISELEHLKKIENKRPMPRKTVLSALKEKIEQVQEVEAALTKKEE